MTGKDLKRLRGERGWTQTELSSKTGVPLGTIGRIESSGMDIKKVDTLRVFEEIFKNELGNKNVTEEGKPISNNNEEENQDYTLSDPNNINPNADFRFGQSSKQDVVATSRHATELLQLIDNQQKQIDLLYKNTDLLRSQVVLLNRLIPKR